MFKIRFWPITAKPIRPISALEQINLKKKPKRKTALLFFFNASHLSKMCIDWESESRMYGENMDCEKCKHCLTMQKIEDMTHK